MKIFCFHGPNRKTKSGISSKLWKIERRGRKLYIWNGPADMIGRKTVVRAKLVARVISYKTEEAARAGEAKRIQAQKAHGCYRKPRKK